MKSPRARGEFIYETTFPVYAAGPHRLLVRDPATGNEVEAHFKVAPVSVERRRASRDVPLQTALASETGGKAYELFECSRILDELPSLRVEETSEQRFDLWNTWLVLILTVAFLLLEWLIRKLMNLR